MATNQPAAKPAGSFLLPLIAILVLSLLSWLFFYLQGMPLSGPETTVVVGAWFLIVFSVKLGRRWLQHRLVKNKANTRS